MMRWIKKWDKRVLALRGRDLLLCTLLVGVGHPLYAVNKPLMIAHRAGLADALENSLPAIEQALKNGADSIWITIQLTKDGHPVVYRPNDLDELTTGKGLVSHYTVRQLAALRYRDPKCGPAGTITTPLSQAVGQAAPAVTGSVASGRVSLVSSATIPTLSQVLMAFPGTHFYLDLKAPAVDANRFATAVNKVIAKHNSYHRTVVYSTNHAYIEAFKVFKPVQRMVARAATREILLTHLLNRQCIAATAEQGLHGFEITRAVTVTEQFKLGKGETKTAMRVTHRTASCLLSVPDNRLILFGVNTLADYYAAAHYGAFAVMVDSPLFFKRNLRNSPSIACKGLGGDG